MYLKDHDVLTSCPASLIEGSGGSPCGNCARRDKPCIYPPSLRKRRADEAQTSNEIETRLRRMEALLQAGREAEASQTLQNPIWLSRPATADSPTPVHLRSALSTQSSALPWYQSRRNGTSSSKTSPTDIHSKLPITVLQGSQKASHLDLEDVAFNFEPSLAGLGGQANYEESEMPSQEIQWEKYASGSWMSVCSQPGQRWVCKRTGSVDFVEIAKALALGLKRRLTIEQELSSPKAPDEPDEATAWTFVQAYFDSSYDSLFGIVNRPAFEARWRDDFVRGNSQSNDPSWVALRYVVYAAGCRCHLAKDHTISFIQARAQAWQYFEKALSLFKDIIFTTKGLTAVQALALMVCTISSAPTYNSCYYVYSTISDFFN